MFVGQSRTSHTLYPSLNRSTSRSTSARLQFCYAWRASKQPRALESITVRVEGDTYLEIQIQGDTRRIPVRTQHEYLGTAVTYQRRLDQNVAKRMQSGQMRYQDIRRTLNGRQALSIPQRTSLWRTCIYTSLMYSVPAVGLTHKGNQKLYVQTTKHLRALSKQPAHLSHIPNKDIWDTSGLAPPRQQHIDCCSSTKTY